MKKCKWDKQHDLGNKRRRTCISTPLQSQLHVIGHSKNMMYVILTTLRHILQRTGLDS